MNNAGFANIALKQMRDAPLVSDQRYVFDHWIRIKANPYPGQRRALLKEFWSLIIFEPWGAARFKLDQWKKKCSDQYIKQAKQKAAERGRAW